MKIFRSHLLTSLAAIYLSLPCLAQTPLERALNDLKTAQSDLQKVQDDNAVLRSALYREINKLDDDAIKLSKSLKKLDRNEELKTSKERTLQRVIDARDAESKFVSGILSNYMSGFPARLSAAERQLYGDSLEQAQVQSAALSDDVEARTSAELKVISLGMERLKSVSGGQIFEGRGLREGESLPGQFVIVGPAAYFLSKEGGFAGIAAFSEAGVDQPGIVDLTEEQAATITSFFASGSGELPIDGSMGKAIVVQASDESLAQTVKKGGIVGYAILGLGGIAILLAIFKLIEINTFRVPSLGKINVILDDLLAGKADEAKVKAAQISGLSGKLVMTGVENFYGKRRVLEETLYERLLAIRPKLDRFLPFLSLTAAAAPLMGLLGTVLGIIKTFKQMAIHGTGNAKSFSAGISEALITTAEGLVVAIPVLIIHGMLRSLSKGRYSQVEGIAVALMNGTTELEDGKNKEKGNTDVVDEEVDDEPLTTQPA